ncbi:MAG: hypothetical protein ACYCO3_14655, partial [Mycobacteriales bacterium]
GPTTRWTRRRLPKARTAARPSRRAGDSHVRHIAALVPQLTFLREAGFEAVDAYWKELDHVIFGGCRPA